MLYLKFKLEKAVYTQAGKLVRHIMLASMFMLFLPLAASAYTIVMRDSRRIEIPDAFLLTSTTLTYEAAPGINVTIQVRHIDAAATERANGETAGAFFRRARETFATTERASQEPREAIPATARAGSRTLTNRELSGFRRAREESERTYERRRAELNLPAPAAHEEDETALARTSRELEDREAQAERYWRARAAALRSEIVSLDAEANFLRARLAESSEFPALNATVVSSNGFFGAFPVPFGIGGASASIPGYSNFGFSQTGVQINGQIGFGGGATRGRIGFNSGTVSGNTYGRVLLPPRARHRTPIVGAIVLPYPYYNYPSERSSIILRLNELEAARAGFTARWQLLEDEARRAGALPGWLR